MLVGFFKSNHKTISILVIFVTLVLWLPSFWNHTIVNIPTDSILVDLQMIGNIKWLGFLVSTFYLSLQAIYLNFIVNKYKLIQTPSYLVALLFVVLNSASPQFLVFNPVFLVNSFLLIIIHQFFEAYNREQVFSLAFNVGLLLALATLIYSPLIVIFPLIWFVLIYVKTPIWREFVISLLGFILPILIYSSYCFLTNQLESVVNDIVSIQPLFLHVNLPTNSFFARGYFYMLMLVGIIAGFNLLSFLNKSVVKIKKLMVIILIMLLLLFSTIFINKQDYIATYLMMTIPLSIIIANYLSEIKKKWLTELIFLVMIIMIAIGYFS